MKQNIKAFHQDEEGHWVADLVCGHSHHVRHDPPFHKREWVTRPETREERKGEQLNCLRCDEVGLVVAKAVLTNAIAALDDALIDSAAAGMCREGQTELALDRLKHLNLEKISQTAIAKATSEFGTLD